MNIDLSDLRREEQGAQQAYEFGDINAIASAYNRCGGSAYKAGLYDKAISWHDKELRFIRQHIHDGYFTVCAYPYVSYSTLYSNTYTPLHIPGQRCGSYLTISSCIILR